MEDEVARKITAERVKRVIKKSDYKEGFEYCELDKPLFDQNGLIEASCSFKELATYIYFTETETNIDLQKISQPFVGEYEVTQYYLIFKGRGKNTLNKTFLKNLKKGDERKVIYADKCVLDEGTLKKHNLVFKQIPYEVSTY